MRRMAEQVKIYVNGQAVTTKEQAPLLQVLKEAGIEIPALCYHPRLGYQGRCSLCAVERYDPDQKNWLMEHACRLVCEADMVLRTSSERIARSRAWAAALLLRRGPFPEASVGRMLEGLAGSAVAIEEGREQSDPGCLLCGRCIAVCRSTGKNNLTFLGRGQKLRVGYVGGPEDYGGCGVCKTCRSFCPTGYIQADGSSAFSKKLY